MTNDNIYKKLQKARCEFQEKPLKKSGRNEFSRFDYFELKDVQPTINSLLDKYNLCSIMSFGEKMAELTVINSENPEEKISFTSPMSTAKLKACHEVQNLGAVETYLRRYLWFAAFEIVERDGLDGTIGKKEPKDTAPNQTSKTHTNANAAEIQNLIQQKQVNAQEVMQFIKNTYHVDQYTQLTKVQADELVNMLHAKPDRQNVQSAIF